MKPALLTLATFIAFIAAPTGYAADGAYPNMPTIPPIGVRTAKYFDVPASAQAPAVDPKKGYRLQDLGDGVYLITDNAIQSMFMVYDKGVVVADAPQAYGAKIPQAIAEITKNPITHVIYSHSHADHIGGVNAVLGGKPVLIAQQETLRLLKRAADPARPLPNVTFADKYTLDVGGKVLELTYHGDAHEPGNIFIYAPKPRVLMAIDLVFPGWMPWRRFAVAHEVRGVFDQVDLIRKLPWTTFIGGHVNRVGTHEDVERQWQYMTDIRQAAADALAQNKPGETLNPLDAGNPWAFFDNYIDRVALQCVNTMTPRWGPELAGFDVWIWDQCFSMEQSLRID